MAYTLRQYQSDAVQATLRHFRNTNASAVIVLPTGAGKSLVIAELARIAKGNILVLAHVKELVQQNHAKYQSYGLTAGIFSAGLKLKEAQHQVTFASIQSAARNLNAFNRAYSLVIIDECHRVGMAPASTATEDKAPPNQYLQLIKHLSQYNSALKLLGLTATPYRMGLGWIYQTHYHGFARTTDPRPFEHCIYELPLRYMIKQGYLTPPKLIDAAIAHYDFSALAPDPQGHYNETKLNALLQTYPRVTQAIVEEIKLQAQQRQGVMIFAATVDHAAEISGYLPAEQTALITGATPQVERDQMIDQFKRRQLRFLVNVSVLTTGFDAPHVDFIAILRPTQSVSLYQQIVGRGLRLSDNKSDCLIIDYAGNGYDLFYPEVGEAKPDSDSVPVLVPCPACGFGNTFWGKCSEDGQLIEHYGRRCWGLITADLSDASSKPQLCDYRFRFKSCDACGAENDIAARRCHQCEKALIDADEKLKAALKLADALVLRCGGTTFEQQGTRLRVTYFDEDGTTLTESFDFNHKGQRYIFNQQFGRRFNQGVTPEAFSTPEAVINVAANFSAPDFVIARKSGHHWRIKEKLFDYDGRYRKANSL